MTRIDQFESYFKAAARTPFRHEQMEVSKVLVVSDLGEENGEAGEFRARLADTLSVLGDSVHWVDAAAGRGETIGELLEVVEAERADLICSYRSLYTQGWRWPFSLGEHLDVLTQATTTPVLVMPRPDREAFWQSDPGTAHVMALTDHLLGDARLVNWAARLTAREGLLTLAHVEDEDVFERYTDAISKIPAIDTDVARELISRQLVKDPREYIDTCRSVLADEGLSIRVKAVVEFGHHLEEVRRLVSEHGVDLLVLKTKDRDQLAMHGLAYPIAVEFRDTPILML